MTPILGEPDGAFDLRAAQVCASSAVDGDGLLDLSGLRHGRWHHADLRALAVLAWWLMSTEHDASGWTLNVPAADNSAWLPLVRSGVIAAAQLRGLRTVTPGGEPLMSPGQFVQGRLPGANWAVLDALSGEGRLRIIPDLADPRRAVRHRDSKYVFPWLTKLGLASAAIDSVDYQRFLADADLVLTELVDNVHRWSRAQRGFAVVSTTRGSVTGGSWNRLHLVIADAGIGIPTALRRDVRALEAVHEAGGQPGALDGVTDGQLVELLMRRAFGDRRVPNHDGHGLNVAQIRAGQWVGALDVVTTGVSSAPLRRSSQGVNPAFFDGEDVLQLPGAQGTLIHLLLQATSREHRRDAAEYEQLTMRRDDDLIAGLAGR